MSEPSGFKSGGRLAKAEGDNEVAAQVAPGRSFSVGFFNTGAGLVIDHDTLAAVGLTGDELAAALRRYASTAAELGGKAPRRTKAT